MSISESKIINNWFSFKETETQTKLRESFETLASHESIEKKKLIDIFLEAIREIDPRAPLYRLEEWSLENPENYYRAIRAISWKILKMKKDEISTNNEMLKAVLHLGDDPETDFGRWLAFFPPMATSTIADPTPEVTMEPIREEKPLLDRLFEILTMHPLKKSVIAELSGQKKKKPQPTIHFDQCTHPSGKIGLCLDPETLFLSLKKMCGVKGKEIDSSAFHYLDYEEGLEFLSNWIERCKPHFKDHPQLILIASKILYQLLMHNKNEQTNELTRKLTSDINNSKSINNGFKISMINQFKSLSKPKPAPTSDQAFDPLLKQLLLRTDLSEEKKIQAIPINERNKNLIQSVISELLTKKTTETLSKALILYNLNREWLDKDKNRDWNTEILISIFNLTLSDLAKMDRTASAFIKRCGDHTEVIFHEIQLLLKTLELNTDDLEECIRVLLLASKFLEAALNSEDKMDKRRLIIYNFMTAAKTITIKVDESNHLLFSNLYFICYRFAVKIQPFIQSHEDIDAQEEFLIYQVSVGEAVENFYKLHPQLRRMRS